MKEFKQASRWEMNSRSAKVSPKDFAYMEACDENTRRGNNVFVQRSMATTAKINDRLVSAMTQGPHIVLKDGTAKGAIVRKKGGVIPGGRVFI